MGGESACANEMVEFALNIVGADRFDFDMGGTNGLMGFLGTSGVSFEVACAEIFFAEMGFYVAGDGTEGLTG